jgi:hypothetical protein
MLGDEQLVIGGQRRDEVDVEPQVVLRPVAGAAGTAVASEGLAEEKVRALADCLAHQSVGDEDSSRFSFSRRGQNPNDAEHDEKQADFCSHG